MIKRRHPEWLKVKIPSGEGYHRMKSLLVSSRLHTICEEAKCPNIAECFGKGTATFLILGDVCTRNCAYCNVKKGLRPRGVSDPAGIPLEVEPVRDNPAPFCCGVSLQDGKVRGASPLTRISNGVDFNEPRTFRQGQKMDPKKVRGEPERVGRIVKKLNLNYVVITSVTRDDLPDGGAGVFAQIIQAIKNLSPRTKIEVLIPDFQGKRDSLKRVIDAKPYRLAHNLETVERLFPMVRPQGDYRRSLNLLKEAKKTSLNIFTKSGIMVGMGETKEEITDTMKDLREVECDIFTIGQYLQPSLNHLPISKYYSPEEFKEFQGIGEESGFLHVESGPLIRSSYRAAEAIL